MERRLGTAQSSEGEGPGDEGGSEQSELALSRSWGHGREEAGSDAEQMALSPFQGGGKLGVYSLGGTCTFKILALKSSVGIWYCECKKNDSKLYFKYKVLSMKPGAQ